ncbi:MAG: hypothetical protein U0798_05555 [Gemmataceae bacterium]
MTILRHSLSLAFSLGAITTLLLSGPSPAWAQAATPKNGKPADDKDKKGEEKPSDKPAGPPSKLPDFSKDFANDGPVQGVVSYADENLVAIHVAYRVRQGNKGTKNEAQEVGFHYAENALARTKVTPTKLDAKGKSVKLPYNELETLKKPQGAPGWHIERSDIKPGSIVTLELIRPKSITASKATLEDKLIKYAIVTGETTPPKISQEEIDKLKGNKKGKN